MNRTKRAKTIWLALSEDTRSESPGAVPTEQSPEGSAGLEATRGLGRRNSTQPGPRERPGKRDEGDSRRDGAETGRLNTKTGWV